MYPPATLLQALPTEPGYWIGGLAVVAVFYLVLRPSFRKKIDPLETPPSHRLLSEQRQAERDLSNLMVEMAQMAQNVNGQIETRCAKLDALLKEADERIATLQAMQDGLPARPDRAGRPATPRRDDPPVAGGAESTDPRHRQIYDLHDMGKSVGQIAQEVGAPRGEVELILALRPRPSGTRTGLPL